MSKRNKDETQKAPFEYVEALETGNFNKLRELIAEGANPDWGDRGGTTPLMRAIVKNDREFVDFLLANNASVNQTAKDKWTALHFCAQDKQVELGVLLISKGANVNAQDGFGNTPLSRCLATRHGDFVGFAKMLLAAGADPKIANNYGISPSEVDADVLDALKNQK